LFKTLNAFLFTIASLMVQVERAIKEQINVEIKLTENMLNKHKTNHSSRNEVTFQHLTFD